MRKFIVGILKGFDPLLNLVLDTTTEYLRDSGEKYIDHLATIFRQV